jgi:hypothetical protein
MRHHQDRKACDTACAAAALAGVHATPSVDEWGRRTVILTAAGGLWVREVRIERLAEALAETQKQEVACTT